jgi:NADP-dependent aldehyde dehydrogenase
MEILGTQFIGGQRTAPGDERFFSRDAATGSPLPHTFYQASSEQVQQAAAAAGAAFNEFRLTTPEQRAVLLDTIAEELEALDDDFLQVVMQESGLPEARVRGERSRTSNQMRLFARVLRRGDFLGARIDTPLPERQPLPRPDIRQYRIPLGPVAVFGASNFPLAFSVAGGDTASALAAGCPVVVKAHPGHPATSELVAAAVVRSVARCALPAGLFGMLFGDLIGGELVTAPAIKAVAFTGSLQAGQALCRLAAQRPEPIPVFAEMSSINPLILLPGALQERSEQIAAGLAASATLGSGQFCTKPGLVIGLAGEKFDRFCAQLADVMGAKDPFVMLTARILKNFQEGLERLEGVGGIRCLAGGTRLEGRAQAALFRADSSLLRDGRHLLEQELFGPVTLLVAVADREELLEFLPEMQGHLTASLFAREDELQGCQPLITLLEERVGRIILNDFPTGVEVGDAMMHGGPYPATSDSRSTSVGSLAIDRFLRPVCYQGYLDSLLPPALQNANPLGLMRLVDGEWSRKALCQS